MAVSDRPSPSRRQFLQRAALLAGGTPALMMFLDACAKGDQTSSSATGMKVASPDKPATWDIAKDNEPIAAGLAPEKAATLQLYSYADYVSPDAVKSFEEKYGTTVQVSTFNDTDEAITKIRAGSVDYDVFFPSYDQIGKLVNGALLRPLNHSYIPNIKNVWPVFTNPFYDQQWRYTTPYTVYTTGIGWNNTVVPADIGALKNPYEALWDPAYKNKTAVIDDWHTAMSMVLLKQGITNVNTSSPDDLKVVGEQLTALVAATSPKVTITMYTDVPTGQIGLTQMWSGDIINAQNYLPEGGTAEVLRYWFPADGRGLVDNDLMVILRGGKNPVLSHLFINHMLETESAKQNFKQIGYQPPQVSMSPDSLVADGFVAENLKSAIVRPEYYEVGYRILELEPDNDAAWHNVWRAFKAGDPDPVTLTGVAARAKPQSKRARGSALGPALAVPGIIWLLLFFLAPLYVVLAIVFGRTDPIFRTAVPVWNPLQWNPSQVNYVLSRIAGPQGIFGPALIRTAIYVLLAGLLCLLLAFPVAYYVARLSGRWKGLLLAALIAPFWISYMMRMLAWVNLLQDDGLVNRLFSLGGFFDVRTHWLTGQPAVVVLGLVYGYVAYMILPLYAGLDRLPQSTLEAARDLGASRFASFWRVTLPMCRPTIVAAVLLTCLPMLGDYFTSDMLSASPKTAMVGNLINDSVQSPGQTGQAGALVMLVLLVAVVPMFYYVRVTARGDTAS